jgi:hypothetical protein
MQLGEAVGNRWRQIVVNIFPSGNFGASWRERVSAKSTKSAGLAGEVLLS